MAYSMMSTTNHKRRCVMSSKIEVDGSSFESSDWINLDLEDFIDDNDYYDIEDNSIFSSNFETSSNLISKKRKTMEPAYVDHDLEDTASSPVQSPKVNHLNVFYMNSKEMDSRDISQMPGNGETPEQAGDSTNTSSLETELRKKGLCLIPTSMLLNYLSSNV
ncbi:vascular-related unknown protein 4-like [Spinacia oleracea]|uniref:Uncharacterized protein n=1 Tax=Spinacia oleracea TaxID=3562 RepID=A0A9R0IFR9_SPIOL|nr:vascular-related unknown protein 4-like [Spinacia oleracea]